MELTANSSTFFNNTVIYQITTAYLDVWGQPLQVHESHALSVAL